MEQGWKEAYNNDDLAGLEGGEEARSEQHLAAEAKAKYGGVGFDRVFGYRKGGKSGVCQTEGAIASRYQKMKDIEGE